jgi:hypothetical protein
VKVCHLVGRGLMLFGALALGTSGGAARGAPNGLTQIPIAKVFGDGVGAFSLAHTQTDSVSSIYTAQYGLWNWLELGVDYQAAPGGQQTPLGNAKVLLLHQPHRIPDVAAGIQNIAANQKAAPYVVATTAPWAPDAHGRGAPGLSLGVIRPSGGSAYQLLAGLSYNLSSNFQLVADGITGPENYRTVGFIVNLSKVVTLNLAYAQPNDGAKNAAGFIFNLAYTLHLKGGGRSEERPSEKHPASGGAEH